MTEEKANTIKEQDMEKTETIEQEKLASEPQEQKKIESEEAQKTKAANSIPKTKSKKKKRSQKNYDKVDPATKKKAEEEVKEINDVKVLREKRDEYNEKTKTLIQEHKQIDEDLKLNRERAAEYKEKRDELNAQVKEFKEKRNEAYDKIKAFNEELKELRKKEQEQKKKESSSSGRKTPSLRKIKSKIRILEQKIITDNLEIKEENEIINQIQELEQIKTEIEGKSGSSTDIKKKLKEISSTRSTVNQLNNDIQELSEESQNFHVLMMEFYRENDSKRKELDKIRMDLRETKVIADEYHNKYRDLSKQQRNRPRSKIYSNRSGKDGTKRLKKKIQEETLTEALKKKKDGKKLNIFEARALFESALDKK
jgi:uncharacterized coiled-coil DUF342 family protein